MSVGDPFVLRSYDDIVEAMRTDLKSGDPPLTDDAIGSVVRTLIETFSRQLAVSYEQLGAVYRMAYFDTAEGPALDQVLALLGFERRGPGHALGELCFYRAPAFEGDIPISAGTRVSGLDQPLFETIDDAILVVGQPTVRVLARSVLPHHVDVEPGSVNVLVQPIEGIEAVDNPAMLTRGGPAETDDELRARVRRVQQIRTAGTASGIIEGIRELGFSEVRVQETLPQDPGRVVVIVGDTEAAEREPELIERLEALRPAGVIHELRIAKQVWVRVEADLPCEPVPPANEQAKARSRIRSGLQRYFDGLSLNRNVNASKILAVLANEDAVLTIGRGDLRLSTHDSFEATKSPDGESDSVDLVMGAMDRVRLGVVELSFIPVTPVVWVDVSAAAEVALTDDQIDALRTALAGNAVGISGGSNVNHEKLLTNLGVGLQVVYVRLTHDLDGRVIDLQSPSDEDILGEREVLKVRRLDVGGQP